MERQGRAAPEDFFVFPGELPQKSCRAVAQDHDGEGQTVGFVCPFLCPVYQEPNDCQGSKGFKQLNREYGDVEPRVADTPAAGITVAAA